MGGFELCFAQSLASSTNAATVALKIRPRLRFAAGVDPAQHLDRRLLAVVGLQLGAGTCGIFRGSLSSKR